MEIIIISLVALAASLLTLFSGFGLGTLLMPVVAVFFPLEIAIGMTAIVHLTNNLFKVAILGKHAVKQVLIRFGVPAVLAAFIGAWVLGLLADGSTPINYQLMDHQLQTTWLNVVVGGLILIFVFLEFSKTFAAIKLGPKFLPLGGSISGFFGGLSGHQGAFRSMFLLKAGLTKEQFIATGVMVAVMVDVARLSIYGKDLAENYQAIDWALVIAASLSAFVGAYVGKKVLQKITIKTVHLLVSLLLVVVAVGLMLGLI
ncbi:sulfite exporter TauE/SafE family protein [Marinicella sp. S1101]|uniref:sulfite exporter TauE/SafE family protein n=1 Tax=Marinicella marina TaxID=2996016 RepID=UPI002260EE5F|nr:sulfite exporter TauE/SafE family protein [Marinicella marina]MCX7554020.1 sulfite exporter TauE/SafE family protein [Marinicella marina]MDJ1140512.1 sulfite exporter TauE/SafE family protein [Marinicella marina]